MGKRILILFFMLNCAAGLQAQDNDDYDTVSTRIVTTLPPDEYRDNEEIITLRRDTTLVTHYINIEKDSIASWKRKKAFAYMSNLDSLLKASQEKPDRQPVRSSGGSSFMSRLLGGPVIKFILIALAILFIGIIAFQLLKSNGIFQSRSKSRVSAVPESEEELLLRNDFDHLIGNAYKIGDYRMAVRYNFLKLLQQLRDKNQINYEPDKTNSRYVYELPVHLRDEFSRLIFQYEYAWYGHFDLDIARYEQVQKRFAAFFQKV